MEGESVMRKFRVYAGDHTIEVECTHILPADGVLIFTNENEQRKSGASQICVVPNTAVVVRISK